MRASGTTEPILFVFSKTAQYYQEKIPTSFHLYILEYFLYNVSRRFRTSHIRYLKAVKLFF